MELAAAIQRSIGLPGTDHHLRGEYSQVFYVFDLGITCILSHILLTLYNHQLEFRASRVFKIFLVYRNLSSTSIEKVILRCTKNNGKGSHREDHSHTIIINGIDNRDNVCTSFSLLPSHIGNSFTVIYYHF